MIIIADTSYRFVYDTIQIFESQQYGGSLTREWIGRRVCAPMNSSLKIRNGAFEIGSAFTFRKKPPDSRSKKVFSGGVFSFQSVICAYNGNEKSVFELSAHEI